MKITVPPQEPFRAQRYNTEARKDLRSVIAKALRACQIADLTRHETAGVVERFVRAYYGESI
jgi:hypothetical protein